MKTANLEATRSSLLSKSWGDMRLALRLASSRLRAINRQRPSYGDQRIIEAIRLALNNPIHP